MDRFHHRGALFVTVTTALLAGISLVVVLRARDGAHLVPMGADARFVALGMFALVFAVTLLLIRHRRYADDG